MQAFSQYISEYLSQNKTISLEKIGTIRLENKDQDGTPELFTYNKKAETSPEFISFLSEKLQKPPLLIEQDFAYFLDEARQLMNIGSTPLTIAGVGHIHATNAGTYALKTDNSAAGATEEKSFTDTYSNSPLTSSVNYAIKKRSQIPWRWILAVIIVGGLIAYGIYYAQHSSLPFFNDKDSSRIKADLPVAQKDTMAQPQTGSNTPTKTSGFKFIFQTYTNIDSCNTRQTQLTRYGDIVNRDTITMNGKPLYRLFVINATATVSDTLHIKDSLRAYFGHEVSVE